MNTSNNLSSLADPEAFTLAKVYQIVLAAAERVKQQADQGAGLPAEQAGSETRPQVSGGNDEPKQ